MILTPEETERFYRIWFPLLHFVNEQRQLVSSFPATREQVPLAKVKPLRDAQEREGIITTLLPGEQSPVTVRADLQKRNGRILAGFRKELARSSMSVRTMEQHVETIGAFAGWLLEEEPPRGLLTLTGSDLEHYLGMRAGKANLVSYRRFIRFLSATGRLHYTTADDLSEVLL